MSRWTWQRYTATEAVRYWAPDSELYSLVVFDKDDWEDSQTIVLSEWGEAYPLPQNWVII